MKVTFHMEISVKVDDEQSSTQQLQDMRTLMQLAGRKAKLEAAEICPDGADVILWHERFS
jgi:hypothetical protein